MECLLDRIKIVMGADLLLLFGWDEAKQEWPLHYHHRLPKHILKDGVLPRAWQSLPTIVQQAGGTLFSDNISKDRRFIGQVVRGMNLRTFFGVTLRSGEKVFGALVICYSDPDALKTDDQRMLRMLVKLLVPFLPLQESPSRMPTGSLQLSLDSAGYIVGCNASFSKILGMKAEGKQKCRLTRFLNPKGQSAYMESVKKIKSDQGVNATPPFRLELVDKGGPRRTLQAVLKPIKKEASLVGFELTAEDITGIGRLEKELVNNSILLTIMHSIFSSLDHFTGEEAALRTAFDQAFPLLGVDGGALFRFDGKKRRLVSIANIGCSATGLDTVDAHGIGHTSHVLWKVIEKRAAVLLSSEGKGSSLDKRQVGEDRLVSYMGVPVESGDQLWGVLSLFSRSQAFFEVDRRFLETLGKEIGFAIDQIRLFHRLQKRVEALQTLNEAGKSLSKSLHLEQILSSTANSLKEMIGIGSCYIFLGDDKRHLFTGAAATDQLGDAIRKFEIKMNEQDLVAVTARERHPFIIENPSRDARVSKKWMRTFKSRSLLAVPLISRERVIGVVILNETRYFRRFTDEEVEKIVGLAEQVSFAIENAGLYNAVSRHRERLQTLSSAIVNIQEEEHRRIAKKLRSDVGEALRSMQKDVSWISKALENTPEKIKARLGNMHKKTGEILEALQGLSHDLRPAVLDESGLIATLKWYIKEFVGQNKTQVHLQTNGVSKRFPARIEILLFRMVQEALSNISDHSDAESAVVSIEKREPYVHLYITDDGKGFDVKRYFSSPQIFRKGIGILGMKERIELAGGTFYIDSNLRQGTRISIRVPIVRRTASS
ncbi:MAG: GAF domain-containing protein [Nitrospiria bacterium]